MGIFLGMALFSCASSYADTYALLVGVSGYPSLAESRRLRGPANDVQLMRAALIQQGVASNAITTLADGVKGSQALPTRQNILAGMRVLATQAKPGDWAIVYFSGHGSQQPQPAASKLPTGSYLAYPVCCQ